MTGIGEIENAMIAHVKAQQDSNALGYKLKKLDSYGGEFDDGLEKIVRDFPAMLFSFAGMRKLKEARSMVKMQARWAVFCCGLSMRNEKASRQGKLDQVGSYQLVNDTILLFQGQTLGLEIDAISVAEVQALTNNKSEKQLASIYGVMLETAFTIEGGVDPSTLEPFETFHANWDIPTFGNVGPAIPDDTNADATDNVELEQ